MSKVRRCGSVDRWGSVAMGLCIAVSGKMDRVARGGRGVING